MNQPSAELKPCPRCNFKQGETKPYIVSVVGSNWFAKCPMCKIGLCEDLGLKAFNEKHEAVEAWNTHLIDKSEPIPGEYSPGQLLDFEHFEDLTLDQVNELSDRFDIYPKGTVARLTYQLDGFKSQYITDAENIEKLQTEVDRLRGGLEKATTLTDETIDERNEALKEVDRLKGDLESSDRTSEERRLELRKMLEESGVVFKKPEAVGCGKTLKDAEGRVIKFNELDGVKAMVCNPKHLCPDCQAKANNPVIPDSSAIEQVGRASKRVQLPEVPDSDCLASLSVWTKHAETFMLAVKAHLDGGQ